LVPLAARIRRMALAASKEFRCWHVWDLMRCPLVGRHWGKADLFRTSLKDRD
jgi:hypothetical protein